MVPLDEESANLCTFNTPFGRYTFIRLPYGLNCVSEVFHRVMTEHFSDIDGVFPYVDDLIIIYAKNKEQQYLCSLIEFMTTCVYLKYLLNISTLVASLFSSLEQVHILFSKNKILNIMVSQNKKPKIDTECRVFNDNWSLGYFFNEYRNKDMCLIY